jgi:hypothetical protein
MTDNFLFLVTAVFSPTSRQTRKQITPFEKETRNEANAWPNSLWQNETGTAVFTNKYCKRGPRFQHGGNGIKEDICALFRLPF